MSLSLHKWATPLVAGAFLLMAATGILMFFHLDSGLNKEAHEWLGWAFVIGATFHIISNLPAFKKKMTKPLSLKIVGVFAVLLLLSFIPLEESEGNGKMLARASMDKLMDTPISVMADVVEKPVGQLIADLNAQGVMIAADNQSIKDVIGSDMELGLKGLQTALK
ncbi:MAG: DUF4405 domain-containing protein [Pseudobdellovibrionaceae bacterium]|nr:DUF4405 domain-containing protein [Pseudobdellovibrionaceae bacterium]